GLLDELQYFNSSADPDVDTPDETVSYSYDDLYRKTSMTDDRGTTDYTYDNDGRITQIDSPEGIINYEYDDLTGQRTRVTTGSPSDPENDFRYTYDSLNRLKTVEVYERNDSALSTPEVTTYSYDAVGNLVRVDQANGVITTYEYDDLYRLNILTHYEQDSMTCPP
ncbi:MAG: RHS repeat protein, partial [Planctomycetaceae bacterium]|nr:RHS repeat protein [Planctomycetaceae bacterium]